MENIRKYINKTIKKNVLFESENLNLYNFKIKLKALLAQHNLFLDNVEIRPDAQVVFDFHGGNSSKIKTNQYYSIINRLSKENYGHEPAFKLFIKDHSIFKKLVLIDNGSSSHLMEKPQLRYYSTLPTLEEVFNQFNKDLPSLFYHQPAEEHMTYAMQTIFLNEQKRLLKELTHDVYESTKTTFTLINKQSPSGDYVDLTYDLKLDPVKLMIVGKAEVRFNGSSTDKPYVYTFTNLKELQDIMATVFDLLKVENRF